MKHQPRAVTNWPRRATLGGLALIAALGLSACGDSFAAYSPTVDLVPALDDPSSIHLGTPSYSPYFNVDCDARSLTDLDEPGPNGSDWRASTQQLPEPDGRGRTVYFTTKRFGSQQDFDQQFDQITDWFSAPCLGIDDDGDAQVEPISLDELPEGAITASWPRDGAPAMSTVVSDRDRRLMMIVIWTESPAPVPADAFVDVVNSAWSDFESNNS